jgi:hypothetical protein
MNETHDDTATPPEQDTAGDPVCWLRRVCPQCGALAASDPPTTCPQCRFEMTGE